MHLWMSLASGEAWCYGEVGVMLSWPQGRQGCPSFSLLEPLISTPWQSVSVRPIHHHTNPLPEQEKTAQQIWSELLWPVSVKSFSKKWQIFWPGGNDWPKLWKSWLVFPVFFRLVVLGQRDSWLCFSMCFWLSFHSDGFGGGRCVWTCMCVCQREERGWLANICRLLVAWMRASHGCGWPGAKKLTRVGMKIRFWQLLPPSWMGPETHPG